MEGVQATSLLTAGLRALETRRPAAEQRINDPLAEKLAGEEGIVFANEYFHQPDLLQIVIIGAGMDTRAYRLDLPSTLVVFELDFPAVHAFKAAKLEGVEPIATRQSIAADMSSPTAWPAALLEAGYDASKPSIWIAEGLVYYLPVDAIPALVDNIARLTAAGSHLLIDAWEDLDGARKRLPTVFAWFEGRVALFTSDAPTVLEPLKEMGFRQVEVDMTPFGLVRCVLSK